MGMKLRYIGLDVHKETIVIAVAEDGRGPAEAWKTIPYDVARLIKAMELLSEGAEVSICYEAGPTGYGLQRALEKAGYTCQVVAPSLIPVQSGYRVKTDRRDAAKLAHFLRSGDLTPITIPDTAREALRDLERSRDDAKRAQQVARHQLSKFLLRRELRFHEGRNWSRKYMRWVHQLQLEDAVLQAVLDDYLKTVGDTTERVEQLTRCLEEKMLASSLAPLMNGLMVLRGVAVVTAATIAAEIGDFRRFATPQKFMAYVGLTPTEDSSGERVRRGSITKCGNRHVRRLLVEAAQHYRRRPAMTQTLRQRSASQPEPLRKIGWEAQKRLHKRLMLLITRGKPGNKAITAVARELAGFVWAIGQEVARE